MHGPSLPAPSGAAGRVQLPIAARCGFCSTNLPRIYRARGKARHTTAVGAGSTRRGLGFDGASAGVELLQTAVSLLPSSLEGAQSL